MGKGSRREVREGEENVRGGGSEEIILLVVNFNPPWK